MCKNMESSITSAASAVQQAQTRNKIAHAVASRSLKTQKQTGEAIVSLVKQVEQLTKQLSQGRIDVEL